MVIKGANTLCLSPWRAEQTVDILCSVLAVSPALSLRTVLLSGTVKSQNGCQSV